ncbi:MAG: hypothetical protein DRR08_00595 [Candidatus Parabeggiatoa sp. nov. 2]|nr:MAG: hypothetical protein B6247_05240 [Beggiatoa sp. 4572_84]RKZ64427.1 MAG: hypothetical protein DRR08_00595 [Gammaproteobacteria bacterium]
MPTLSIKYLCVFTYNTKNVLLNLIIAKATTTNQAMIVAKATTILKNGTDFLRNLSQLKQLPKSPNGAILI